VNPDLISRRLLRHGLVVFLLGLGAGLALLGPPGLFKSPRLALSAHLVGVSGGMFVIIAGVMLDRVRLSMRELVALFWLTIYGAYGNWGGSLLGGIFGTQTMTSIASAGASASAPTWQEAAVGLILTTSGTATLAACLMLLWGLRGGDGGKDL
jgi:hydroxylaminobenzene mutase